MSKSGAEGTKNQSRGDQSQYAAPTATAMDTQAGSELLIQPLPWRCRYESDGLWAVIDAHDALVFYRVTRDEAEFICRAVNTHDDLVAALKWLLWRAESELADPVDLDEIQQAHAVLARVEGQ